MYCMFVAFGSWPTGKRERERERRRRRREREVDTERNRGREKENEDEEDERNIMNKFWRDKELRRKQSLGRNKASDIEKN